MILIECIKINDIPSRDIINNKNPCYLLILNLVRICIGTYLIKKNSKKKGKRMTVHT